MTSSAPVLLIVGNTGAGKSTYAAQIEAERNGITLANDPWMATLYGADFPAEPSYEWALERTQRIERQILAETVKITGKGIPVLLDLGFFGKDQRDRVRAFFAAHDIPTETHYLDVSSEIRWQRVHQRNTEKGATYQFKVSREVFEFCETIFEAPTGDELDRAIVVHSV